MRMEPTESSETSAINVTWTPGTYSKDNKLHDDILFSFFLSAFLPSFFFNEPVVLSVYITLNGVLADNMELEKVPLKLS